MSIVLNNKKLINGVNPKLAKEICRCCSEQFLTARELSEYFEVTLTTMIKWLNLLTEADYLYMHGENNTIEWGATAKGKHDLSQARLGKPISGSKFLDLILKVINRIHEYNSEIRYPFFIDAAYLFGPVLIQPWVTDDPNIIIDVSTRPEVKRSLNWRIDYCNKYGPERSLNTIERLFYPENELIRFLCKQKEYIDICFTEDSFLPPGNRLIYLREEIDSKNTASSAPIMSKNEIELLAERVGSYRSGKHIHKQRKNKRAQFSEIVSYWENDRRFQKLNLDSERDAVSCWRCGSKRDLQHCHIIPASLGGSNDASNYVILCARCHAEGPNLINEDIMFDWISAYRKQYSKDYWREVGAAEYEFIYGKSVQEELDVILKKSNSELTYNEAMDELNLLLNESSTQAISHFGQSWLNNATIAGLYRIALKEFSNRLCPNMGLR